MMSGEKRRLEKYKIRNSKDKHNCRRLRKKKEAYGREGSNLPSGAVLQWYREKSIYLPPRRTKQHVLPKRLCCVQ